MPKMLPGTLKCSLNPFSPPKPALFHGKSDLIFERNGLGFALKGDLGSVSNCSQCLLQFIVKMRLGSGLVLPAPISSQIRCYRTFSSNNSASLLNKLALLLAHVSWLAPKCPNVHGQTVRDFLNLKRSLYNGFPFLTDFSPLSQHLSQNLKFTVYDFHDFPRALDLVNGFKHPEDTP